MAHRVLAIFRRRLFNLLTILSLLLCLATVALWVRSYWRSETFDYVRVRDGMVHGIGLNNAVGELSLYVGEAAGTNVGGWYYHFSRSPSVTLREVADSMSPGSKAPRFLGFSQLSISHKTPWLSLRGICFPHWFPALLFAILPLLRLRSILHTRRQNRIGLCPHCGYDLRATPDRCPECGHACDPNIRDGND